MKELKLTLILVVLVLMVITGLVLTTAGINTLNWYLLPGVTLLLGGLFLLGKLK